jgi:hypothetical protein
MFVMMATVATRSRSAEDSSRPRSQLVENGASETTPATRKRNRHVSATSAIGKFKRVFDVLFMYFIFLLTSFNSIFFWQIASQDENQQIVDPPKRRGRGPNLNRSATRALEGQPEGSKISLTMAEGVKNFVGDSGTQFATECGIVVRSTCPMKHHTWESVPELVKVQMHEKLQVSCMKILFLFFLC